MSRARKTTLPVRDGGAVRGLKTRFKSATKTRHHGVIRRIVGTTPMQSIKDAATETVAVAPQNSEEWLLAVSIATKDGGVADKIRRAYADKLKGE